MTYTDDERAVVALSERIEEDLIRVLERHGLLHAEAPRCIRRLALHAVRDLDGKLMLATLALEGEDARPEMTEMARHLMLLVSPVSRSH